MEVRKYKVSAGEEGKRIDKFLADENDNLSRSFLQKLIDRGKVTVDGRQIKSSYNLNAGDTIKLEIPEPKKSEIKPVEMDLDIIYEDKDIIVVNKAPGMVVHPTPDNKTNTLVNGLYAYADNLAGIGGVIRPGIVHRLDKETSGVMVVAKNDSSHRHLVRQFRKRNVKKIYRTIVEGRFPYRSGKIDAPIGRDPSNRTRMAVTKKNNREAITLFKVIKYLRNFTYLELKLKTGRTHQIRVHFSHYEHPVVGDEKYDSTVDYNGRQLLHAYKLGFIHPTTGEKVEFRADLPEEFIEFIEKWKK